MPNQLTVKQLCICQICICGEHKCNPDNPYEICSVRGVNKVSTGVGDYIIGKNDIISEAERAARREKCRKQWQISPEALKSIANSYPKVSNPSASSAASGREGRGGPSRRSQATSNNRNSVNSNKHNNNNNNLNHNRKLPPIERSAQESGSKTDPNYYNEETDHYQTLTSSSSNQIIVDKLKEDSITGNHIREGAESSFSQIMENHRETSIDVAAREDQSISCEPEWIVSRPMKAKPTDNLRCEGPMELETTFRSTIDSSAAQRLNASRQEGRSVSPIGKEVNGQDLSVPLKRRHRPQTSLKPGGEGSYSTINKESYKNFVVVDQSREKMVQERLDALAKSMDEKAQFKSNGHQRIIEPLQPRNKASTHSCRRTAVDEREQNKSRSKRSMDQPTKSSASEQGQAKASTLKSSTKVTHENAKSDYNHSEMKEQTIKTRSKNSQYTNDEDKIVTEGRKQFSPVNETYTTKSEAVMDSSSSEMVKNSHQSTTVKGGDHVEKYVSLHDEVNNSNTESKNYSEVRNVSVNESKIDANEDKQINKTAERRAGIKSNLSQGRGSTNVSPIPTKSGGTVPFAVVPIVRPSPIRPTSSLTMNGKFKADITSDGNNSNNNNNDSMHSVAANGSDEIMTSSANVTKEIQSAMEESNVSQSKSSRKKDHYTIYEESLKVERERFKKASKSNPSLDKISRVQEVDKNWENYEANTKEQYKRARSLPRNRPSRNRNESHLRFSGDMEFETTTKHFFQDGSQVTEYIRESRLTEQRKPHRDLFRTSSEAELKTYQSTSMANNVKLKKKSIETTTTYNSVFRNKLYCPAVDLTPKNPEYQYKGEAGGHHFFLPVTQY